MDINEFYTTAQTSSNGNEYSATLPNLTDYTTKGFVPYYLGWIDKDNIPETYHLTKISFDGTKLISKPLEITENADLFYTARNINPLTVGGLSFASRYNSASGSYTSYYGGYSNNIEAVNKMSLLTQNINPPSFTFSFIYRPVSGGVLGNTLIANYNYNFPSIITFINWLNGTYKINFNSVFSGITLTDVELSADDFLTDREFPYIDSSYNGYIIITACTVSPRPDTDNNTGYSSTMGSVSVTYKDEDDIFDMYLHSQYHPTGHVQIFYSGTPRLYGNPYTFYGYYFGGFDIETDLAEMSDTTEIYQGENWLAYRPYNLSNYRYFYKKMSISEIRFLFAMQPILRYTNDLTNIYYPKFEDNELTGEFFPASRLAFEGAPWQITDNVTDNDYDPDTKPAPSDDDPSGTPTNDKKGKEKITKDEIPAFFNRSYQIGNTVSFYALSGSEVSILRYLLMQQSDDFYSAVQKIGASSFYEFINSFRFWPINLNVSSSVHEVFFANEVLKDYDDSPVQYRVLTNSSGSETICYKNTYVCFWNLANLTWENNFLDYEPYTKLTLTLPYAGTFDLDLLQISAFGPLSSAFLKLYASIDFETGILCYCLALSNPSTDTDLVPLLVKQVKIAVDIALNANNATAQSDAILNAGFNNIQKTLNLVNAGTKMVTTFQNPKAKVGNKIGATTGAISSIADSAKGAIDYANATRAIPVTIGANSGSIASTFYCQHPYLSHYHPRTANPDNYDSAIGYLWEGTATIKNLSGFSIARNPNLKNIQATEEEKNLISEILTTGFYA